MDETVADYCDYCYDDLPQYSTSYLRAVGMTDLDGMTVPQVKTWCGQCSPDDEIDAEAAAAVRKAVQEMAA